MSKSYHRHANKFDDDYEEEQIDTKTARKVDRFTRQMKKLKFNEDKDHDT